MLHTAPTRARETGHSCLGSRALGEAQMAGRVKEAGGMWNRKTLVGNYIMTAQYGLDSRTESKEVYRFISLVACGKGICM